MEKADRIRTLKKKEAEVLYLICKGKTNQEIITELKLNHLKTLSSRVTIIYEKLNIQGDSDLKRDRLLAEYKDTVLELINEENLKTWIPVKIPPIEKQRYENIEKLYPDELEIIDPVLEPVKDNKPQPTKQVGGKAPEKPVVKEEETKPNEEAPKKKYPWYFVAILIFIVLIFLFWFFSKSIFPRTIVQSNASTQTSTAASIVYIDTQKTTVAPSNTTNTQIPQATSTLPLSITPTNTITPAPTPDILFSDDFENGLSPYWTTLQGKAYVTNGQLAANEATWLAVGDPAWTNIEIDYDTNLSYHADCSSDPFPPRYYTVMVGLRFQDLENMVALKTGYVFLCWFTETNGKWVSVPGTGPGPWYGVWSKMSIRIEGDKYTAYVNGKKSTSFVDSTYPSGKIAIYLNQDNLIDNFKIIQLP